MDRDAVSALVMDTLAGYRSQPPPPGSTIGVPWSTEKISGYVEKLRSALVEPYLEQFETPGDVRGDRAVGTALRRVLGCC